MQVILRQVGDCVIRRPGAPGPFALSDETALRRFATDAALEPVDVFDVESPFIYANEAAALRGLNSSGVAARAMDNTSEEAVTDAHAKAIIELGRFDYTADTCKTFHRAVEQQVVPAVTRLNESRMQSLGIDQLRPWDLEVDPAGRPHRNAKNEALGGSASFL